MQKKVTAGHSGVSVILVPGKAANLDDAGTGQPKPALPPRALSFEQVYSDHFDFVWRCARRLGVSEGAIDDIMQQVFLVVHRRLADFEGRSSPKTWLFSILLRTIREHRRLLRRKSPHLLGERADPEALADASPRTRPDEVLDRVEASRIIDHLLDALEGDKKVVFVMAELEQMSAAEIADATGLNVKGVYSRLRAARTDFERAAAALRRRTTREVAK